VNWVSAHTIIRSYEDTIANAVNCKGRIEPFLQQLQNFDIRIIEHMKNAVELSKDISIKALKSGMMRNLSEQEIENNIEILLNPQRTLSHGRPLYYEDAKAMGLSVAMLPETIWKKVWELYMRIDWVVSGTAAKVMENEHMTFQVRARG